MNFHLTCVRSRVVVTPCGDIKYGLCVIVVVVENGYDVCFVLTP